jgi:hypothetical protein
MVWQNGDPFYLGVLQRNQSMPVRKIPQFWQVSDVPETKISPGLASKLCSELSAVAAGDHPVGDAVLNEAA